MLLFLNQSRTKPRTFSRAWHRLRVFSRLAPVTCFRALGTGYVFFRAWHWLRVFPRLAPATCFPALGTGYVFSRAWHRLRVFVCFCFCLHVCALSSDWFIALFAFLVIGQM